MKKTFIAAVLAVSAFCVHAESWIRVNQIGYLENDTKVAVMIMQEPAEITSFTVTDAATGKTVTIDKVKNYGAQHPFAAEARLDFSEITEPGRYTVTANGTTSPEFVISNKVYAGANEFPLKYMRQQRCGHNPYLNRTCHLNDGRIVLHPTRDGEKVDVTGGWHDASDYLQYVTTSANATYQMMFAYQQNPEIWGDEYNAEGKKGSNGIPDILDEVKWGLDWLVKMNPNTVLSSTRLRTTATTV